MPVFASVVLDPHPPSAVPRMPCSGASSATSFRSFVRGDQVEVGSTGGVDARVIGDEPDPLATRLRWQSLEEHPDAGTDVAWNQVRAAV